METLKFEYEAKQPLTRRAHVGVVGSGDLEVLIEPSDEPTATSGCGPASTAMPRSGRRCSTDSSPASSTPRRWRSTTSEQRPGR